MQMIAMIMKIGIRIQNTHRNNNNNNNCNINSELMHQDKIYQICLINIQFKNIVSAKKCIVCLLYPRDFVYKSL